MDTGALVAALDRGVVAHAVIDTWEDEPGFSVELMERADLATPHIAGYSYDGKVRGTEMVYRGACGFLGVEPAWSPAALLPPPAVPLIALDAASARAAAGEGPAHDDEAALREIVRRVYDVEADDRGLRGAAASDRAVRGVQFDRLRKTYAVRREFAFSTVRLQNASPALAAAVAGLGFNVAGD
jgi:erythronate-4-phosphate dehydrogenase